MIGCSYKVSAFFYYFVFFFISSLFRIVGEIEIEVIGAFEGGGELVVGESVGFRRLVRSCFRRLLRIRLWGVDEVEIFLFFYCYFFVF